MLNIISLGAGVQSSTMALMAAHGEITPMPDCAIFADTQSEPKAVYEWLNWLEKQLPFPVFRVTQGSLKNESLKLQGKGDVKFVRNVIPAFSLDKQGNKGMLLRKCTADFKIAPIKRKQRSVMKERGLKHLYSWIGISTDEAHRMKPSGVRYATNIWPLIDKGMTRGHCLEWMKNKGYPQPPKSACTFCPYHADKQWKEIKDNTPDEFLEVVEFEKEWNEWIKRDGLPSQLRGKIYLHRSCVPLDQVRFDVNQTLDLFGNECEGMCGI